MTGGLLAWVRRRRGGWLAADAVWLGACRVLPLFRHCGEMLLPNLARNVGFREGPFGEGLCRFSVVFHSSSDRGGYFISGCVRCADIEDCSDWRLAYPVSNFRTACLSTYCSLWLVILIAPSIASRTSGRTISFCPRNCILAPYRSRISPCWASCDTLTFAMSMRALTSYLERLKFSILKA